MKLETNNHRICKFYTNNPNIDFEAVNLIFIDLFEKLLNDMNDTMNTTLYSEILSNVNSHSIILQDLKSSFSSMKKDISNMNNDITSSLLIKFMDIKKEYIEDVKSIITTNTSDKISLLLDKNNNQLIDKTQLLLNDIVPKTQDKYYKQIFETIQMFHKNIEGDTKELLKYFDKKDSKESIKDFISQFDAKSSLMIQTVQQPIYSFISASEERINHNISLLKENTNLNQIAQSKTFEELSDFMSKYRHSLETNTNGKELEQTLSKLYNTSKIIRINGGHFLMSRYSKPTIFIHNSVQDSNIDEDETKSFIHHVEQNNCNGVFLSQHSGIIDKQNYQIEIHAGNILVYVHSVEYSKDKIKIAIDIIDNLYSKLGDLNKNETHTIPKDVLDEINREYNLFIHQKETISNTLKESHKKILMQLDDLKLPSLDKFLSTKYSSIQKQGFKCNLCNSFTVSTLKGLAAHKRGCSRKIGTSMNELPSS
jgi:hypothetical protein